MSRADPELTDEDLVRRLRAGDSSAGNVLFERYFAVLRPGLRRRIGPALRRKVGESDIIQSAYLAVVERLDEFEDRGRGSFRRWLGGILDHKLRDEFRRFFGTGKRNPHREVSLDSKSGARALSAKQETPSDATMRAEEARLLQRCLEAMPPDYRAVIELVHRDGLTHVEAAKRMGRSPDAVRKLYGRAVSRLAEERREEETSR